MTEKQSRPLLTKMLAKVIEQGYAGALREREAVERSRKSRSDSLAANLIHYERALQRLERVSAEVEQQVASMGDTQKRETPWPDPPPKLRRPWPNTFPPRPILPERPPAPDAGANGRTNAGIEIPAAFHPDNVEFDLSVGEYEVTLTARYADGINRFEDALENFLEGRTSSRWYAIGEAQRAGIRWPQLDRYLAECPTPWLPEEFVGERFGLRGTLAFRDRMADLMSLISPEAAIYYFDTPPGAFEATPWRADMALLDELVSVGLAQWGGAENLEVIATKVPYPEWRSMFILAGLKPPRSFREVAERLQELLAARSQEKVLEWVEDFVEPSKVILVREPEGCSSEDRLGIRARANVMVSTLVLMGEGDSEDPRVVVDW